MNHPPYLFVSGTHPFSGIAAEDAPELNTPTEGEGGPKPSTNAIAEWILVGNAARLSSGFTQSNR